MESRYLNSDSDKTSQSSQRGKGNFPYIAITQLWQSGGSQSSNTHPEEPSTINSGNTKSLNGTLVAQCEQVDTQTQDPDPSERRKAVLGSGIEPDTINLEADFLSLKCTYCDHQSKSQSEAKFVTMVRVS